jgi:two-component system, NtrC family, response regulator HydG
MHKILLVDDDPAALDSTKKILEMSGYTVVTAVDGQAALDCIRRDRFNLVVSDVRMPRLGGLEFLRALSLCGDATSVILMTAFGRVEDAVWAMKLGAVDFLTKPFKRQTLISSVEAAIKRAKPKAQSGASHGVTAEALIGTAEPMQKLREWIEQVAPTSATVLITGESGTGKELVARCIHRQGARATEQFIALNCAAVPEQLIESELFGFEKGAFTGATAAKEGLFEAAHGGTLFLDEIGDMPITLQAKLLRVLQEGEMRRLGATNSRKVDVRVIAATNRDLHEGVRAGSFRQDLLFRLEVVTLQVPPLRERATDIQELAYHFLAVANRRHGKNITILSAETITALQMHSWPGNVRELSNVIERAVIFATQEQIHVSELPPHLISSKTADVSMSSTISVRLGTPLKEVEELLIRKTLEVTEGDKNMTAKLLGINSRTIYRKLDKRPSEDS